MTAGAQAKPAPVPCPLCKPPQNCETKQGVKYIPHTLEPCHSPLLMAEMIRQTITQRTLFTRLTRRSLLTSFLCPRSGKSKAESRFKRERLPSPSPSPAITQLQTRRKFNWMAGTPQALSNPLVVGIRLVDQVGTREQYLVQMLYLLRKHN